MINFIVWIIVGAIIGWVASRLMGTDGQQGVILDIVVGVVGALVAGWIISPMLNIGTINQGDFSLPALLVSLVGAIIRLAVVKCVRRGGRRYSLDCPSPPYQLFPKPGIPGCHV
jgi:uncharacterized membrane protein YeaQ/YmgE (transglycosylase-associated protein family)